MPPPLSPALLNTSSHKGLSHSAEIGVETARVVLNALDADQAGAKQSWTWWAKNLPKAKRWPVPEGKDLTDAYLSGLDLRSWFIVGALGDERTCDLWEERAAIMEFDGGLQRGHAESLALREMRL